MASNMKMNTITGADLRAARESLNLTQTQVARQAHLSSSQYLSAIERGLRPGSRTLARIAKAVGLDASQTSGGTGSSVSSAAGGSH
jgi:transcriptional regulator with XRE-family HTH domain